MNNLLLNVAVMLLMGITNAVYAGAYEEGITAYHEEDYNAALSAFRKAAEQDNAEAMIHLGGMYAYGRGVPIDEVQAAAWYRKAAEQDYAKAQVELGNLYAKGIGVPQDDVQAVSWYRKAAEQGYAGAQLCLGLMYNNGRGVIQDYVQAYKWWHVVALSGDKNAIRFRDLLAKKMTPAQISEAKELAVAWKPKKNQ